MRESKTGQRQHAQLANRADDVVRHSGRPSGRHDGDEAGSFDSVAATRPSHAIRKPQPSRAARPGEYDRPWCQCRSSHPEADLAPGLRGCPRDTVPKTASGMVVPSVEAEAVQCRGQAAACQRIARYAAILPQSSSGMPGSGQAKTWRAADAASHTASARPQGSAASPVMVIPSSL